MRRPVWNVDAAAQVPLVSRRRDADFSGEQRAERAEAAEADIQAHVRHRMTPRKQSLRSSQSFPCSELVRRFAKYGLESADEVE
jgi:hypothetical protein